MSIHDFTQRSSGSDKIAALALDVINALSDPLAVIGSDGRMLFGNPAFSALFSRADCEAALCRRIDAAPCHITAADGRVFVFETAILSQNLLVTPRVVSKPPATDSASSEMVQIDALTQLGDREMFREHLTALLARPNAAIAPAAVLIMNLDRFKAINASLGHAIGDKLLRVVADRLRSTVAPGGRATRLGSDEFAIIQPGQHAQSAAEVAKRVTDLLGRTYIIDGHLLNIGVSTGVALIPADGTGFDQILKNASLALRQAKLEGPGRYRFFSDAMDEEMQAKRSLEIDLRRALALREFVLVYQPQCHVASQQITGFEALIRWHHPKRGLVSPAEFVPLAEEIGLIVPIGEWVIRRACRDAVLWPEPLNVAVNVSPIQFCSPDLGATIRSSLAESGLQPYRLELEITESTLLADHQAALDLLHELRGLGLRVAMDDFGTGYSSLSYLRSFPFDKIKIDQSFIRNRLDDPTDHAIVRTIAALGRSLGIPTVAEGVETKEQLSRIAADGCTDVQGYLISRPIAVDKIADFLRDPTHIV